MTSPIVQRLIALMSIAALTACGSGGGGDGGNGGGGNPPPSRTAQTIVYSAGDGVSVNGVTELYSVDDDGNGQTLLSSETALDTTSIQALAVSPDGQWVAYISNIRSPGETDLYVNSINGGDPVRVSRTKNILGGRIQSFDWSPDSSQLVYAANVGHSRLSDMAANEVFVVNRDGSDDTKINGSIGNPAIVEVRNPQWSPDGRYILQEVAAFSQQQGAANPVALNIWDSTISTPNSRRLVTSISVLRNAHWSADSARVSYTANQEQQSTYRVYAIGVDGTNNTRVAQNGDFNSNSRWSPTGSMLAYLDHPSAPFPTDLFVSAAVPGATDTLLAYLSPNDRNVFDFRWSPDGTRMAYTSDEDTQNTRELHVVNTDGSGSPTKVSGPQLPSSDVFEFAWSPDGNSIAYVADADTDGYLDLYVSHLDGGPVSWVSMGLSGEEVVDFGWSDDSQRIVFSTGPEGRTPQPDTLYVSGPDGSGRTQITDPMMIGPLGFEYD